MTGDKWITWSKGLKDLVNFEEMAEEEAVQQEEALKKAKDALTNAPPRSKLST